MHFLYIYIYNSISNIDISELLTNTLVMMFGMGADFGPPMCNPILWYISAFLFSILPLSYLCLKDRNKYLYVIAPIGSLLLFGIINHYGFAFGFTGIIRKELIRSVWGMLSGGVAYVIYEMVKEHFHSNNRRIVLTILEIILYILVLGSIFTQNRNTVTYVMVFAPLVIGISFSECSYVSEVFRLTFLNKFGSASLWMYLFHYPVVMLMQNTMPKFSFKTSVMLLVLLTSLAAAMCYWLLRLIRWIWEKKFSDVFADIEPIK